MIIAIKITYFYQQLIKLTKKIFICATEQSGDNIGYNIILNLLKLENDIIFEGVGGSKMKPFLKNQFYTLADFNKMGIIEVIFSIKKFIKMINFLLSQIIKNNYDLIVTIDSPDFNFALIEKLHKRKIKYKKIHFVAPSVWAWRKYRAKKFSKIFDEIVVLFKFEIDFFKNFDIKTTLMGHPVYYIKKSIINPNENLNIAFLPGSRVSEIKKLLPYFRIAYNYLYKNYPNLSIFIPTLPHLESSILHIIKDWKLKVIVSSDESKNEYYYQNSIKALVCSGTATLEIAQRNIPQLIIYKLNFLTVLIAKGFIKVKYANILNIIENKMIIPEITNQNLNNKIFLSNFIKLMNNENLNLVQIKNINKSLLKIQSNLPPYEIATKTILKYLN